MKIKTLIIVVIFLLISDEMKSQNGVKVVVDSNYFQDNSYADDLLVGGEHFFLTCKETETNGGVRYQFKLEKDTLSRSFKMINIKPRKEYITILQVELLSAIKKLNQRSLELTFKKDSRGRNQILNNVSQKTPLTFEERVFLSKLVKDTYLNYGSDSQILEDYLDSLKTKLDLVKNDKDSKWIDTIRISSKDQAKEIVNQINLFSTEFLTNAYLGAIINLNKDTEIGILYANPHTKIDLEDRFQPPDTLRTKRDTLKKKVYEKMMLRKPDIIIIKNVDIKFESEQIAGIKVIGTPSKWDSVKMKPDTVGKYKNIRLEFQNRVPIPYSTKAHISNIGTTKLYEVKEPHFIIKLGDVIYNDYRLVNQTEDYSPKDQVITIKPGEKGKVIKKEDVTSLLNAAIFSDIIGFNSSQPNGLIQTEFSRRFYLNRKVIPCGNSFTYWGVFNSIRPKITFSKLESNNKTLELNAQNFNGDSLYVSAIDILKHTSWSSGGTFNISFIGLPNVHSMLYFNGGVDIFHVPMRIPKLNSFMPFQDINPDEDGKFSKNFLSLYPEMAWVISPHPRFQISYTFKYHWLLNLSDDFDLVADRESFLSGSSGKKYQNIINIRFLASMRLSNESNNQIFFRSYYNCIPGNFGQNYFQAQLGYAFNIFDWNTEPPPLKPFQGL